MSFSSSSFCSAVSVRHLEKRRRCSSVSSACSPSEKNWARVRPKASHITSRVDMLGMVFRLNILEMVDWERPDSFASRYSLHPWRIISSVMRAFVSKILHLLIILYDSAENYIAYMSIDTTLQMRYSSSSISARRRKNDYFFWNYRNVGVGCMCCLANNSMDTKAA